jgi:glutamate-1-semialdehyde 2,1-aminomutase
MPDPAEARYRAMTAASQALMDRAVQVMPGGNTRSATHHGPYPLTLTRGSGAHLFDADGNAYVDLAGNFTSLVHGHAYPPVIDAVTAMMRHGTVWPALAPAQIDLAELLCSRISGADRVRFCNSGTEAAYLALKIARAVTGRDRALVASGGYHGMEPAWITLPDGTRTGNILYAAFNDADAFDEVLGQHGGGIAAVFLELVQSSGGMREAELEFVRRVAAAARRAGALFVLDEVVTLRLAPGGLQGELGVEPDLTMLGKIIGGGFPSGAVCGRAEFLDLLDPRQPGAVRHAGTYNGNPISCRAGEITIRNLSRADMERMSRLAERLCDGMLAAAADAGVPLSVRRSGSLMNVFMSDEPPAVAKDRADGAAMSRFHLACLSEGVFFAPRGLMCLSTVMDEALISEVVDRMARVLARLGRDAG